MQGIENTIQDVYRWLCDSEAGRQNDKIILTGFSRGAHAARALALLITDLGLIRPRGMDYFDSLFQDWIKYRGSENNALTDEWMQQVRTRYAEYITYPVWIDTIAVFDTVGTMGMPWPQINPRPDQKLGFVSSRIGNVRRAYHAMALDEVRKDFPLWETPMAGQQVHQYWLQGSHSDVGGGDNRFLSYISLIWMISMMQDDPDLDIMFDTGALTNKLIEHQVPPKVTNSHTWKYKASGTDKRKPGHCQATERVHKSVRFLEDWVSSCDRLNGPYQSMEHQDRWYWHTTGDDGTAVGLWGSDEERHDSYEYHEKHYLRIMGLID